MAREKMDVCIVSLRAILHAETPRGDYGTTAKRKCQPRTHRRTSGIGPLIGSFWRSTIGRHPNPLPLKRRSISIPVAGICSRAPPRTTSIHHQWRAAGARSAAGIRAPLDPSASRTWDRWGVHAPPAQQPPRSALAPAQARRESRA